VLYDKRFGLLQENVNEEAMNFITAVKTVGNLSFHWGMNPLTPGNLQESCVQ
jgi:hypothetical protein